MDPVLNHGFLGDIQDRYSLYSNIQAVVIGQEMQGLFFLNERSTAIHKEPSHTPPWPLGRASSTLALTLAFPSQLATISRPNTEKTTLLSNPCTGLHPLRDRGPLTGPMGYTCDSTVVTMRCMKFMKHASNWHFEVQVSWS